MSGQKRKFQLRILLLIYPGKLKHAKYSHSTVLFPQIVKVEPRNVNINLKLSILKINYILWVSKLENKINKLETFKVSK